MFMKIVKQYFMKRFKYCFSLFLRYNYYIRLKNWKKSEFSVKAAASIFCKAAPSARGEECRGSAMVELFCDTREYRAGVLQEQG